jgi:hypothetical protein
MINSGIFLYSKKSIMLKTGDNWGKSKNNAQDDSTHVGGGYIFSYSQYLSMDSFATFNATQRGCLPETVVTMMEESDPVRVLKSKYYNACKVNGGSGLGRGSLGMLIDYTTCKWFLPKQQSSDNFKYATPGTGGEVSINPSDTNNTCYGGGVVHLLAKDLDLLGNL